MIGLLANTCIESTSRFAMERSYHVTLVKDATAAFSKANDARCTRVERSQLPLPREREGLPGSERPNAHISGLRVLCSSGRRQAASGPFDNIISHLLKGTYMMV